MNLPCDKCDKDGECTCGCLDYDAWQKWIKDNPGIPITVYVDD